MGKISYERRVNESVDDWSLVIPRKSIKKTEFNRKGLIYC